MNLNKLFINHCKKNNLDVNPNQVNLIEELNQFHNQNFNKSFLKKIFSQKNLKPGFYLQGDVGVGKTMILNFFYESLKSTKQRLHFNEFMISFHDFVFQNKKRSKINPVGFFVGKRNIYLTIDNGKLLVVDINTGKTKSILKIDNEKISRPFVLNQNLYIIKKNSIIKLN